jgi:hypothetical protein
VDQVTRGGTVEILEYLYRKLDAQFRHLREHRQGMDPVSPVFALEHDLGQAELDLLKTAVRAAVHQGLGARPRRWWLPFVVYAAEVGYDYEGDEYWPSFEAATPTWGVNGDRQYIKTSFVRFADQYGGAVPTGAWAETFRIICWPITHAVLPTYLQRQLAKLLFEYRAGLTSALLNDPQALGVKLASRTGGYTERFRTFCQNTSLLGQVATALLLDDDEDSPYLLGTTLHRLLGGLSSERQSRAWLRDAKRFASQVRSSGFRPQAGGTGLRERAKRLPTPTDPKLFLRRESGGWRAYAGLPDLASLQARLPHVYDELRKLRAWVAGLDEKPLASGRVVYPGQEIRFSSWPRTDIPFLQLERGSTAVNALIADQCVISPGPWWLFRKKEHGPAVEVKGMFVRPGGWYCLVGREKEEVPRLPWITPSTILANGVRAFELAVPPVLGDDEVAALIDVGISVRADVRLRPVGLIPTAWDGDGTVEWPAGDPAMIGIHAERVVDRCVLDIDGNSYFLDWPDHESDLFIALDGLVVGSHDVTATLLPLDGAEPIATGSLIITIRDPEVRPEGATQGEGLRVLASPARPTLSELWDERASLTIEGPSGVSAELSLVLRGANGGELARLRRHIELPITETAWHNFAKRELRGDDLRGAYDRAEYCEVTVSLPGVGRASLVCERGFQALRWILTRERRRQVARLIDRTDGDATEVEFFAVESPTIGIRRSPDEAIELSLGGLLRATSGSAVASIILPPDPNQLVRKRSARPMIRVESRNEDEVVRLMAIHRAWLDAELPADPFAKHQQLVVLDALTREVVSLIAGPRWQRLESSLDHDQLLDRLDDLQVHVGEGHQLLARGVAKNLWEWARSDRTFKTGFDALMASVSSRYGLVNHPKAADFVVALSKSPGDLMTWGPDERENLIKIVWTSPALIRAARFAVLGIEALRPDATDRPTAGGRQ